MAIYQIPPPPPKLTKDSESSDWSELGIQVPAPEVVTAGMTIRLKEEPEDVVYLLSGPHPQNPEIPGTSLSYNPHNKKLVWTLRASWGDHSAYKVFESEGRGELRPGVWARIFVTYDWSTGEGDIQVNGTSVKASEVLEGDMQRSLLGVCELGFNGMCCHANVANIFVTSGTSRYFVPLFDTQSDEVTKTTIATAEGGTSNPFQWSSGNWEQQRLPVDAFEFTVVPEIVNTSSSTRDEIRVTLSTTSPVGFSGKEYIAIHGTRMTQLSQPFSLSSGNTTGHFQMAIRGSDTSSLRDYTGYIERKGSGVRVKQNYVQDGVGSKYYQFPSDRGLLTLEDVDKPVTFLITLEPND